MTERGRGGTGGILGALLDVPWEEREAVVVRFVYAAVNGRGGRLTWVLAAFD